MPLRISEFGSRGACDECTCEARSPGVAAVATALRRGVLLALAGPLAAGIQHEPRETVHLQSINLQAGLPRQESHNIRLQIGERTPTAPKSHNTAMCSWPLALGLVLALLTRSIFALTLLSF